MRTASALAALVVLAAPLAAADPVNLKWSLKDGDKFYASTSQELNQTIKVMGQTVDQKMTTTTVARFDVKSAKTGALEVQMTYTQVQIKMNGPLAAAGAGANALTDRFKGATLTATFDKNFEITKLDGYDKFLDKLSDGDEMMRKVFETMMPENAVRVMFSQVLVPAPSDKVNTGHKWSRTDKVPLPGLGDLTNKTQFTLDSVKNDVATIKTTADVTFKAAGGGGALPFKITKADLKSDEVKGTILFDTKGGRLKSSDATMKLKGSMTIEVQNMEIEAELEQKMVTKTEILEKNPVKD
ncbi:Uncharacterized protein OS=Niabella soli DSM 19437 GN=NIASO_09635 PE=4 SV=1 [Gemmata massiliana]|uniref:Uncharacterized protein n=1 Tax=Gemmata massiliana TaxID=1210884 RepID=A0A6P2DCU6_9BACT|nr:DUF6263 family protein [Gemmata massiliana]VTR99117.1 Uncharacterized protein OS=Niabella soli DSM 19437 GN=NIASO_09635 PE=4 SV=1 [Gemmata massiliana]